MAPAAVDDTPLAVAVGTADVGIDAVAVADVDVTDNDSAEDAVESVVVDEKIVGDSESFPVGQNSELWTKDRKKLSGDRKR